MSTTTSVLLKCLPLDNNDIFDIDVEVNEETDNSFDEESVDTDHELSPSPAPPIIINFKIHANNVNFSAGTHLSMRASLSQIVEEDEEKEENDCKIEIKNKNKIEIKPNDMQNIMEYRFNEVFKHPFSRFYKIPNNGKILIDEALFSTVELYLQRQKFLRSQSFSSFEFESINDANIIIEVYYKAQKAKFEQFPKLKEMLIQTKNQRIVSIDNDEFWGMSSDNYLLNENDSQLHGQNNAGKILMKIREEFKNNCYNVAGYVSDFAIKLSSHAKVYSLWLCPPSEISNKLSSLIQKLSIEFGTECIFEPHISIAGCIFEYPLAIIKYKLRNLIANENIKPLKIQLKQKVSCSLKDSYFQCVFMEIDGDDENTQSLMRMKNLCRQMFKKEEEFMPHLSLMFGDIEHGGMDDERKRKAIDLVEKYMCEMEIEMDSLEFVCEQIELWSTNPNRHQICEWQMIEAFPLNMNVEVSENEVKVNEDIDEESNVVHKINQALQFIV